MFVPAANGSGASYASFTFQVRDNGGTANGGVDTDQSPNTMTINVNAVNDAPTATSLTQSLVIHEDAAATQLFTVAPAVADIDSATVTATLTLNASAGVLVGAGAGVLNAGVLTYTITGTPAAVNTALGAVTYDSAANFHGTASVGITVTDGANGPQGTNPTGIVSITVNSANDAPAGTDHAVLIAEDTTYTFGVADFGFSDPDDSPSPNLLLAVKITTLPGAGEGTLTNNGNPVNAGDSVSAADIAAGHLVFTPVLNANGSPQATFTFQVQDDGGTANGGVDVDPSANTFTINVNAGNDAPINSVPGTQSVNEEATLTFSTGNGNAITISDVDIGSGDETVTLTVTGGTLALGSTAGLTSFTNNAASITLTGTVANVNAALNGLTYTGNLNFSGADSLLVSTNDNGNTGTGGPQNDTDSITINVAAVNDAPVNSVPGTQTVNEDTNLVFTGANAIAISDVDGGSGDQTVTLTVASGTLALGSTLNLTSFTNNAASITLTGTIANINAALDGLTYHGNLNFNGADSLSIVTHDNGNTGGGDLTDTDSVTINVTAVNDAPSFTVGGTQTVLEDSGAHTVNGFITGISPGPADEVGQTVNFLTSNDNNALFSVAPTIDASGNLTYTLAANANGSAIVTVQLHDNGGGANGGSDTSGAQTFTITAGAVNDAPAGVDNTFTILEDGARTFTAADFGFSDPVDAANTSGANAFQAVIITTLPGAGTGTLTLNAVPVTAGQSIAVGDIGGLVFTPAANANGNAEASFTFQVQDNGSTANAGVDTDQSANTITFDVTAINDAPAGTDTTIASVGPHTFAAPEFGFTDPVDAGSAGGANVFQAVIITTIPGAGTGTLELNGVPVTAGQTIAVGDIGGLVFTPNGNNTGTFTFQVQDNGGTANSGVDTDQSPNSFTIQQNAPPVIDSDGAGATAAVSAAENQTAITTVHATDPDNGPVTPVSYSIVGGDDQLKFAIDSSTGALTFITPPDFENPTDTSTAGNNTYIVTVQATDGASIDQQTITVTVTDVNDAPVITSNAGGATASINVNENGTAVTTVTSTDQDSPAQTLTYSLAGGADQGKFSIDSSTGVLTFNTAPNFEAPTDIGGDSGYDVIIRVTDNGAPNLHDDQAITVHVQNVNEAPDTGAATVTGNEDAASIAITLSGTDVDSGDSVASFHITNIPNTGTQGTLYSDIGLTTVVTEGADVAASGNAATLYFVPNADFNTHAGAVTFNAAATDTHGLTDATPSTETINVTAINDAPTNNGVPSSFTVQSGFNHVVTGLSIADLDANEVGTPTDITTTLTAGAGTVVIGNGGSGTAGIAGGATITTNGSGTVVLTGSVAQINTTLSGSNVAYNAADNAANTTTTLQIATNDHGHNGTPGAITDTDTINIGVIPQVWFINQDQSSLDANATRGSQANPFSTVAEFNASSGPGANDYIYVKAGTYSGDGINLKDGQILLGDDQALSFANPLGGPAIVIEDATGARPTINVTTNADQGVDLASNNTVQGVNITTAVGTSGIDDGSGANSVGNLTIGDVQVSGAGQAVDLDGGGGALNVVFESLASSGGAAGIELAGAWTGTFTGGSGTLSGHSSSEISISGGSGNFSYAGAIGDGTGLSASIANRTGGTVTLSGNINDSNDTGGGIGISGNANTTINFTGTAKVLNTGIGDGVSMTNNTGTSNVNFTNGGLDIDTSNGSGFIATVAGTYNVTGTGNSITTNGNGSALNLDTIVVGGGGLNFDSTSSTNSTGTAVAIDSVTGGAIALGTGSISGSDGDAFRVGDGAGTANTGGTSAITYAGSISKTDGSGQAVDIQDRAAGAGNITLSGNITHNIAGNTGILLDDNAAGTITFSGSSKVITSTTATAVNLTDNAGATIAFTNGGLVINTTAGNGFNATGPGAAATTGGTVTVEGSGNTIASTTGTALNVVNTTIGANDLTFQSISSNGGANGIVLNNTGTSGGLIVTGTDGGDAGTIADAGTGGTIQNKSGDAIVLNNTRDVSLNGVTIANATGGSWIDADNVTGLTLRNVNANNSFDHGIDGTNITNLVIQEGLYQGGGTLNGIANINGINITNLLGTSSVTDATFERANTVQFRVNNNTATNFGGAPDTLTVSGTTWQNHNVSPFHGDHLSVSSDTGGNFSLNVNNTDGVNTFKTAGIAVQAAGAGSGKMTADISGIVSGGSVASGFANTAGVVVVATASSAVAFNVHDNTMLGTGSLAIAIRDFSTGAFSGTVSNNNITHIAGPGTNAVDVTSHGDGNVGTPDGTATVAVLNNTIVGDFQTGIFAQSAFGDGRLNINISGNTVHGTDTTVTALRAIEVVAGGSGGGNTNQIFLNLQNNNAWMDNGNAGYRLFHRAGYTFSLEDLTGDGDDPANITNWIDVVKGNNSNGGAATTLITGAANTFTSHPTTPSPLLAAAGGVAGSSSGDNDLTPAELAPIIDAAMARWESAGASAAQMAALAAITFSVADLSGDAIGQHSAGHIVIDTDAAGHGWFIDSTPSDNSEFANAENADGTDLSADPASAAAGQLDLLTAVVHEMGHELGLVDSATDAHDLMYVNLVDGERRLPDATDVALANPAQAQAPLLPVVRGTAGNDTINAGLGGNILVGEAGADNFVFSNVPVSASAPLTHVADYSFTEGDVFDFSALTASFHGSSVNDTFVVRAVEDASGAFATLQVNAGLVDKGVTPWVSVAQIDGAQAGDNVSVLIDSHGAVHLAHLHIGLLA